MKTIINIIFLLLISILIYATTLKYNVENIALLTTLGLFGNFAETFKGKTSILTIHKSDDNDTYIIMLQEEGNVTTDLHTTTMKKEILCVPLKQKFDKKYHRVLTTKDWRNSIDFFDMLQQLLAYHFYRHQLTVFLFVDYSLGEEVFNRFTNTLSTLLENKYYISQKQQLMRRLHCDRINVIKLNNKTEKEDIITILKKDDDL